MAGLYIPRNIEEQYHYDALWKHANPSGASELAGPAALSFFKKARPRIEVNVVAQLWGLTFSSLKAEEFYTAVRFITLMQKGEVPLSQR